MDLASKLKLKPNGTSTVSLAVFGDANRSIRNLGKAIVDLQTQSGEKLSMKVLIVLTIAAPLQSNINFDARHVISFPCNQQCETCYSFSLQSTDQDT